MPEENYMAASEFCSVHNLCSTFVRSLEEYGLIETVTIEDSKFIRANQLARLQQIARLHHELDINLEGIYAIMHLLQRMRMMQKEMDILKKRLSISRLNGVEPSYHHAD